MNLAVRGIDSDIRWNKEGSFHKDELRDLAPDIVAAILDDASPNHITLFDLAVDPPALWDEQRERVGL